MKEILIPAIALIAAMFLMPVVFAADANYYAIINVYHNVPVTKSFNIQFASSYSGGYNETASNATLSNWISFNYSTIPENEVEPYTNGSASDAQAGITQPIVMILNTGNADLDITTNISSTANFDVCANSTDVSACTAIEGSSLVTMCSTLTAGSQCNVTLYSNVSAGTAGGQSGPDEWYLESS